MQGDAVADTGLDNVAGVNTGLNIAAVAFDVVPDDTDVAGVESPYVWLALTKMP